MNLGSLTDIPLINICPDDGTGRMLAQHGLNVSNYPTLQAWDVNLNEGDVLYILNPSQKYLKKYGSLVDIPGTIFFEVIRYVWRHEDVSKRREIEKELFPFDEAKKLLDKIKKQPKPQIQKQTVYLPAGRIDLGKILDGLGYDKVFFTADTHFSDPRLLYHRRNYFASLAEMDQTLIDNWNAIVPEDGVVFHLGDFGYGKNLLDIAKALNGRKYIIGGNHDVPGTFSSKEMQEEGRCIPVGREQILHAGSRRIFLCHYPYLCYEGEYSGTIQLFGHIHTGRDGDSAGFDAPRTQYLLPFQYDVGVDNNDFRPISLQEILQKFPYDAGPRIEHGDMRVDRIDEVQAIAEECLKGEDSDGKPALWIDTDYSTETLKADIDQGYAHALCIRDEVVGYYAVVPADNVPSVPITWKESDGPACYIQRLFRAPGFKGGVGVSITTAHRGYKDIRVLVPESSMEVQSRMIPHLFECMGQYTREDGTTMIAYQRVFQ